MWSNMARKILLRNWDILLTNCWRNSKRKLCTWRKHTNRWVSFFLERAFVFQSLHPSKRDRYIIKIFIFCESKTCFLSYFSMYYTGSSTDYVDCQNIVLPRMNNRNLPSSFDDYNSPSKVVLTYRFITDEAISK